MTALWCHLFLAATFPHTPPPKDYKRKRALTMHWKRSSYYEDCYSVCFSFFFFFFPPLGKKSEKFSSGLFNFRAVSCTEKGPPLRTLPTFTQNSSYSSFPLLARDATITSVQRQKGDIYIYIKKK